MKITGYMMLLLGLAISAQAVLVDDFEGYSTGIITQVTGGKWVPVFGGVGTNPGADSPVRQIAVDPTDPVNKVIYLETNNTGQYGMYGVIPSQSSILDNTTGTFFCKFYVTTTALDQSFGLTSIDTPTSGGYANFNCQVALVRGNLLVRNGGSSTTVGTFAANTWYYVWIVVNNTANTYSVYVKTTPSAATVADRVAHNFAFRSGTADGDLDRFYTMANYGANITAGTRLHFDNMAINPGEDLSLYVSGAAFNPYPAYGAIDVDLDVTLTWNTGVDPNNPTQVNPNITRHYVYLRSDPNLPATPHATVPASGATGSYKPAAGFFETDKTYYWRIDESVNNSSPSDPRTIRGSVWSFSTVRSSPILETHPQNVRVDGSNPTPPPAQFTVTFRSEFSPALAVWKKYVDGVNDQTLTAGSKYGIVTTGTSSTLSVNNPQVSDQGWYYCVLTNYGGTSTTNQASLIISRLLAQYNFENNFNDAVGSSHGVGKDYNDPENPLAGPTFGNVNPLPGSGSYAVLDGLGQYVDFGTGAFPKAGLGSGLDQGTILCWVRPTKTGVVLSNYNDGTTTGFAFSLESNADARINLRGESVEIATVQGKPNRPGWNLLDNTWHMLAVRWNAQTQVCAVYVDGQWVVADTSMGTPELYADWQRGVILGASRNATDRNILQNFLGGAVDNLRIYNYMLTPDQIAQEYLDATGIQPCVNMTFTGSAYNFDNTGSSYCRIDLADFVSMAQNWLDCGLYPDCRR